jgi:hypothetical protein
LQITKKKASKKTTTLILERDEMNIKTGDRVLVEAVVKRFYDNGNVRLDFQIANDNEMGLGEMNLPETKIFAVINPS